MENASKALIIAGAILLSILLISLGIMVYNNARNTVGSADLSDTQIKAFNSQFTSYTGTAGKTISASELTNLLEKVMTSNLSENKGNTGRYVYVTGAAVDPTGNSLTLNLGNSNEGKYSAITSIPAVSQAKKYKVVPAYSSTTSLLWKITVSVVN